MYELTHLLTCRQNYTSGHVWKYIKGVLYMYAYTCNSITTWYAYMHVKERWYQTFPVLDPQRLNKRQHMFVYRVRASCDLRRRTQWQRSVYDASCEIPGFVITWLVYSAILFIVDKKKKNNVHFCITIETSTPETLRDIPREVMGHTERFDWYSCSESRTTPENDEQTRRPASSVTAWNMVLFM